MPKCPGSPVGVEPVQDRLRPLVHEEGFPGRDPSGELAPDLTGEALRVREEEVVVEQAVQHIQPIVEAIHEGFPGHPARRGDGYLCRRGHNVVMRDGVAIEGGGQALVGLDPVGR